MTSLRFVLTFAALVAAAAFAATALGGPPPPVIAHIGVTHLRPVAGHTFTGVTVVPTGSAAITGVFCPARVKGSNLESVEHRFYDQGLRAITCSWRVPKSARGTLSTQVTVNSASINTTSAVLSWRIKR